MNKIDIDSWKNFEIRHLFDVIKGTRLTKANMRPGKIRFIGSSAMNNGWTASVENNEYLHPSNTLTVCYNGSIGETFYQDEPFWASDDVNVLYPKFEMNKNIGMFIAPLIRSVGRRYAFVDKWRLKVMEKDTIKLPVENDGNPNWEYMDSFMQKVMIESRARLSFLRLARVDKTALDITEWQEFQIGKLFTIVKPLVLHSREVVESEEGLPYVVRTKFNNGIKCLVVQTENMKPSPAGVITFGSENATFFYQEEEFVSGRDIYYIDTRNFSKLTCLFLTACLQPIARKYSYNYGLFPELLKQEKIKLPVDTSGAPDWQFMSTYMSILFKEKRDKISELREVIA